MDPSMPFMEGGELGMLLNPMVPQGGIPGVPPGAPPMPQAVPPQSVGGMVPETIAAQFAQMGIGPQGVIRATQPQAQMEQMSTLGSTLDPVPMPPTRPMGAPMDITAPSGGTTEMSAQSAQPGLGARLQGALKGVQAPPAPTLPRVSTPSVPGPRGQIKGGELFALLNALGMGGANIPSLGSAIK